MVTHSDLPSFFQPSLTGIDLLAHNVLRERHPVPEGWLTTPLAAYGPLLYDTAGFALPVQPASAYLRTPKRLSQAQRPALPAPATFPSTRSEIHHARPEPSRGTRCERGREQAWKEYGRSSQPFYSASIAHEANINAHARMIVGRGFDQSSYEPSEGEREVNFDSRGANPYWREGHVSGSESESTRLEGEMRRLEALEQQKERVRSVQVGRQIKEEEWRKEKVEGKPEKRRGEEAERSAEESPRLSVAEKGKGRASDCGNEPMSKSWNELAVAPFSPFDLSHLTDPSEDVLRSPPLPAFASSSRAPHFDILPDDAGDDDGENALSSDEDICPPKKRGRTSNTDTNGVLQPRFSHQGDRYQRSDREAYETTDEEMKSGMNDDMEDSITALPQEMSSTTPASPSSSQTQNERVVRRVSTVGYWSGDPPRSAKRKKSIPPTFHKRGKSYDDPNH